MKDEKLFLRFSDMSHYYFFFWKQKITERTEFQYIPNKTVILASWSCRAFEETNFKGRMLSSQSIPV